MSTLVSLRPRRDWPACPRAATMKAAIDERLEAMTANETMSRVRLNPRVEGLRPSATLAINETCARLKDQGRKIYHLGFGQSPFPVPEKVVAALEVNAFRGGYSPVRGLPALREAIAEYHRRFTGIAASADGVLIGPGTKELIFLLQLTFDGDLLLPS